jgi:SAM-dependent methyltransferase
MKRDALPAGTPPAGASAAWRRLVDDASARYRAAGRFAYHFARGKLKHDPVFRALVEGGLLVDGRCVDIGCGQGLLASLLTSLLANPLCGPLASLHADTGGVRATHYHGIELMARDVARAQAALEGAALEHRFVHDDMRRAALPACDCVVILDVLHYVDHAAQAALLGRVRDALAAGRGRRLLLRVGDMHARGGFAVSQWVDRLVTRLRGHRVSPTWGRPLAEWAALLEGLGFAVRSLPMSAGTPFANVLLVADLKADPKADLKADPKPGPEPDLP